MTVPWSPKVSSLVMYRVPRRDSGEYFNYFVWDEKEFSKRDKNRSFAAGASLDSVVDLCVELRDRLGRWSITTIPAPRVYMDGMGEYPVSDATLLEFQNKCFDKVAEIV